MRELRSHDEIQRGGRRGFFVVVARAGARSGRTGEGWGPQTARATGHQQAESRGEDEACDLNDAKWGCHSPIMASAQTSSSKSGK